MEDSNSASESKAPEKDVGKSFKDMTLKEKVVFVLQVLICILTFGFVFPNALG
jgi:hypothetical protein